MFKLDSNAGYWWTVSFYLLCGDRRAGGASAAGEVSASEALGDQGAVNARGAP